MQPGHQPDEPVRDALVAIIPAAAAAAFEIGIT
jgi:hypothetical protein